MALNLKIDLDTKEAQEEIKKLEQEWEQAKKQVVQQREEVKRLSDEIDKLTNQLKSSLSSFFGKDTEAIEKAFKRISDVNLDSLTKQLEEAQENLKKSEQNAEELGRKLEELKSKSSENSQLQPVEVIDKEKAKEAAEEAAEEVASEFVETTAEEVKEGAEEVASEFVETTARVISSQNIISADKIFKLDDIKEKAKEASEKLASIFRNTFSRLSNIIIKPFNSVNGILSNISDQIRRVGERILKLASYTFIFNVINAGFRQIRDAANDYINTNNVLTSSLSRVRGNLLTAFQPIWETILPYLIQFVKWIEKATAYVAAFISSIFGRNVEASKAGAQQIQAQIQASKDASKALGKQKSNTDKLNKATEKTNKTLAQFDELNVLGQSDKTKTPSIGGAGISSSAGSGIDFSTTKIDTSAIDDFVNKLKTLLKPVFSAFERLRPQLERLGKFITNAFVDFYNEFLKPLSTYIVRIAIPEFIDTIGDSLSKMNFDNLNDAFKGLFASLEPIGEGIIQGFLGFTKNFVAPLSEFVINTALPDFLRSISDAANQINLDKVNESLNGLWRALEPLAEDALKGALWIFDKFLKPLSVWTVNEAIPRFINLLTAALEVIKPIAEAAGEQLQKLYDAVLKPIGQWTGGVITQKLDEMTESLKNAGEWLRDPKNKTALEWISAFIIGLGTVAIGAILVPALWSLVTATTAWTAALLANPITWIVAAIAGLIASIVMLIIHFDDIKQSVINAWGPIKSFFEKIGKWFDQKVKQPIIQKSEEIKNIFGTMGPWFDSTVKQPIIQKWNDIKNSFGTMGPWFDSTVKQPIINKWTDIKNYLATIGQWFEVKIKQPIIQKWNDIKYALATIGQWFDSAVKQPLLQKWSEIINVFGQISSWFYSRVTNPLSNLWNNVISSWKREINGCISVVEGFINRVIRGINLLTSKLSRIGFDIPEWLGGGHFGINIPRIAEVSIPRLAQGTVIPPNSPFLAMLGDQRNGTNIEAPLDTIKQAFLEAMQESGGYNTNSNYTFVAQLDGRTIFEETIRQNDMFINQSGRSAFAY